MPLPNNLVFIDTETTGGSGRTDRIIEVGVIRVENNQVVKTFQTLIDPGFYISPAISNLTGILAAELDGAPTFRQISDELFEILDGAVMVAHNAGFDYSFLKNEFKNVSRDFSPQQLCTVKLSRSLFPQYRHHNLDSIIERFGFDCQNRHRALDDARVLWQFYQKILEQFNEAEVLTVITKILAGFSGSGKKAADGVERIPYFESP